VSIPKNSDAYRTSRLLTNSGFFRVQRSVKNNPQQRVLFFDNKEELFDYLNQAKVSNDLEAHLRLIQQTADLKLKLVLLGEVLSPLMGRYKSSKHHGVYNAL